MDDIKLDKNQVEYMMPLSNMQKGMLFHYLKDTKTNEYFEQLNVKLKGEINIRLFEETWKLIVKNNEALRTVFRWNRLIEPIQIILKSEEVNISYVNLSDKEYNEKEIILRKIEKQEIHTKFNLIEVPFRIKLCKVNDSEYEMIICNHHILYDGWSTGIILKEFISIYNKLNLNKDISIQKKTGFKEFIAMQNKANKEEEKEYWKSYLYDLDVSYLSNSKMIDQGGMATKYNFNLECTISEGLKKIASDAKVTLSAIIYSAWGLLLQRSFNTDDVLFGTAVSGRDNNIRGVENIVGLFINTVPLRVNNFEEKSLIELIKEINNDLISRKKYENTSLNEINRYVDLNQNLFDTLVVVENYPLDPIIYNNDRLKIESYSSIDNTNFNLTLEVMTFDNINFSFNYNNKFYTENEIKLISKRLENILLHMIKNNNAKIKDMEFICDYERNLIINRVNNTDYSNGTKTTIIKLFEMQVSKTPDKIAVIFENQSITYKELNSKANQLARKIECDNKLIAIAMDRSIEMIIGILAILKSGKAYVPIDPEYPLKRIEYILNDSCIDFVITQKNFLNKFPNKKIICVEDINLNEYESENLNLQVKPEDLAYVIYTSGTTGSPKGIQVEHFSITNTLIWRINYYKFNIEDTVLQLPSFTFDSSVEDIFTSLLSGGKLVLIKKDDRLNLDKVSQIINENNVTSFLITPALYRIFLDEDNMSLNSVKKITVAGEAVNINSIQKHFIKFPNIELYNEYGPSENSVCTTVYRFSVNDKKVKIGKPINNVKCFILNEDENICPIGVIGELCVSGQNLTRGYINNKELTDKKFIYNSKMNLRMYKTGDLAKWDEDGNIEFIGRKDNQVKINGFRIELEEVEKAILTYEDVEQVIVDVKKFNNGKELCAYLLYKKKISLKQIKGYLYDCLPRYMIPTKFFYCNEFNLTTNGKLDRNFINEENIKEIEYEIEESLLPNSEIEEKLKEVWKSVFRTERIGINNDFFELGGDSIKAIQISSRLRKFNLKIEVDKILKYTTIKESAKYVEALLLTDAEIKEDEEILLTPIQKWFFDKEMKDKNYWNQSIFLESKERLNIIYVKQAINKIVKHHDALRMAFEGKDDNILAYYKKYEECIVEPKLIEIQDKDYKNKISQETSKLQKSLDISKGLLIKTCIFRTMEKDYLFIVVHHLAIDGVSWRIMIEDLLNIYKSLGNNGYIKLPEKTTSYQLWSKSLNKYANSETLLEQAEYWQNIQQKSSIVLNKKKQVELGKIACNYEALIFNLNEDLSSQLLKQANRAYNTEINDLLLVSLSKSVMDWVGFNGQTHVLINLEGHGREKINENIDVTRTIGWFTDVYPITVPVDSSDDLSNEIINVKEALRNVPDKGIGYGILKYITNDDLIDKSKIEVNPEIAFNYLGQLDQEYNDDLFNMETIESMRSKNDSYKRDESIYVEMYVIKGKLTISLEYNTKEYDYDQMCKLREILNLNLNKVIEHCVNKKYSEKTIGDFSHSKLKNDDLDSILDVLNQD